MSREYKEIIDKLNSIRKKGFDMITLEDKKGENKLAKKILTFSLELNDFYVEKEVLTPSQKNYILGTDENQIIREIIEYPTVDELYKKIEKIPSY